MKKRSDYAAFRNYVVMLRNEAQLPTLEEDTIEECYYALLTFDENTD